MSAAPIVPGDAPTPSPLGELARLRRAWIGPFLFVLLLLLLIVTVVWLAASIPVRFDLSSPEGSVVERAWTFSRGGAVYDDWRPWPHTFAPYGPLTYYPVGWLARCLSDLPDPWSVTLLGRGQSLLSLLLAGWLLYRLARRADLTRRWAIVAISANALWSGLLEYCSSYRPDAPVALMSIAALWLIAGGPARPMRLCGVLAFLMAAMWFKPTAWGMVLVAGLWAARTLGWRRAAAALALWGVTGLGLAWALDALWDGRLLLNLLGGNRQGWSLFYLHKLLGDYRSLHLWAMGLGAIVAVWTLRRGPADAERWIACGALATLAVSLATSLKVGADKNYFMAPFPLLMLTLTIEIGRMWRAESAVPPALREAILWCVLLPAIAIPAILGLSRTRHDFTLLRDSWRPLAVSRRIQGADGPILTTRSCFPLQTEWRPTILDAYAYSAYVQRGLIDPRPLEERISHGEFALIVIDRPDWTGDGSWNNEHQMPLFFDGYLAAVRRHYRLIDDSGYFLLFEPRSDASTAANSSRFSHP
jgi:hypothetical protein